MNRFVIGLLLLSILSLGGLSFVIRKDILASENEIGACTPYDLKTSEITENSFKVDWKTEGECIGFIKYGDTLNTIDLASFDKASFEKSRNHTVNVTDLAKDSTYYILVISEGKVYSVTNTPIRVMTKSQY